MAPPNQIMIAVPQPILEADWIQKGFKVLSIIQLRACASLVMASSIYSIWLVQIYGFKFTHGSGIWTGLIFGINGAIGLSVAKETSKCNLIALVVMSIVSILCSLILIGQGGLIGLFGVAIRIIYFIIGLVEAGNAIATAVLSCHVICCVIQW